MAEGEEETTRSRFATADQPGRELSHGRSQVRVFGGGSARSKSTKKITKAMELVATSRIAKAQDRVAASTPYAEAITGVLTALASNTPTSTTRCSPGGPVRRAGVLVITSDRGLAGGYNANAIRTGEQLIARLRADGKQVLRRRSQGRDVLPVPQPRDRGELDRLLRAADFEDAREVGETLIEAFVAARRPRGHRRRPTAGWASTSCTSSTPSSAPLMTQTVEKGFAPMEVEEPTGVRGPAARVRVRAGRGGAARRAAAEVHQHAGSTRRCSTRRRASRRRARRAMKTATDNADEMIKTLHAGDELGPPGRDHPGDQRDRRRRERAGRGGK